MDEDGGGWFWRHVRRVGTFVEKHPEVVPKTALDKALAIEKGFDAVWRKKVIQFQTPLFSSNSLGLWLIRFESVLADGLEQGPLQREDVALPPELTEKIAAMLPRGLPPEAVCALIAYYAANRPEDTDWVVLPVANFDAYFGNTSFGRKWLQLIPREIMERESGFGVCRYRVREEFQIKV